MKKRSSEEIGAKIGHSGSAEIFEGFSNFFYLIKNPLTESEQQLVDYIISIGKGSSKKMPLGQGTSQTLSKEFLEEFQKKIVSGISLSPGVIHFLDREKFSQVQETLSLLLKQYSVSITNPSFASAIILDNLVGYGILGPILRDINLEEIMVNGSGKELFIYHKAFGMCKTNLVFLEDDLLDLTKRIAATTGKKFDDSNPFLDARLSSGERVNASFSSITTAGISMTIRKFNPMPLSVIDLILNETISTEVASFLWVMVEGLGINAVNLIVTGGASSGKTTTLNVLTSFINRHERIITIEDPIELNLGNRDNWVQMETWQPAGVEKQFLMDDLLRNSFRMRPDRIIIGEVRGEEAQTLFVAMDIGHQGIMGTLHANTAKETMIRLNKAPMNVPEIMIPLLNLIVVQYRRYIRGKGIIRRVSQIAEISSMDGKPLIGLIYELDRVDGQLKRTDIPSHLIEDFAKKTSVSKKDVLREISVRRKVIEWLVAKRITKINAVEEIIQSYYNNPQAVLELVLKDSQPGPEQKK